MMDEDQTFPAVGSWYLMTAQAAMRDGCVRQRPAMSEPVFSCCDSAPVDELLHVCWCSPADGTADLGDMNQF